MPTLSLKVSQKTGWVSRCLLVFLHWVFKGKSRFPHFSAIISHQHSPAEVTSFLKLLVSVQGWWLFKDFKGQLYYGYLSKKKLTFSSQRNKTHQKTIHIFAWLFFCGKNIPGFQGPPTKHAPGFTPQELVSSDASSREQVERGKLDAMDFAKKVSSYLAHTVEGSEIWLTSWGWYSIPLEHRVVYIPGGCLGFLPSTVSSMGEVYVLTFGLFL